jgi:hypothetical protein
VQRGEMGTQLAGLAGARSPHFLLCLSGLSVTVVLGTQIMQDRREEIKRERTCMEPVSP